AALTTQPVVRARDQFGNNSTTGLPSSKIVTLALTTGTGSLLGSTSLDIGTAAGNAVATFTNLEIDSAGTNKQLTASASGFTNALSTVFTISPAAAHHLTIQTQPSATATAGTAFANQPVIRIEDAFGNLRSSDNATVVTASRNAGSGVLQGTTSRTAVNGVVTFLNLSHNVATNITLAFNGTGLAAANSDSILVSPAAADRLVFIAQPASMAYGSALSPQPVLKSRDPFGNDSTVGIGTSKMVALAVSAGTGSLQGTTSMDIGTLA